MKFSGDIENAVEVEQFNKNENYDKELLGMNNGTSSEWINGILILNYGVPYQTLRG